jgi:hypothetical protein
VGAAFAVSILTSLAAFAAPRIHISTGPADLTTLKAGGLELLYNGALTMRLATLRTWEGAERAGDDHAIVSSGAHPGMTRYAWGRVQCACVAHANRVDLAVTVTNTSADVLQAVSLSLGELTLLCAGTSWQGQVR